MAFQVPNVEPSSIIAGDLATWTRSFGDFPSSEGWALSYSLVKLGQTNQPIPIAATVSGGQFLVSVDTSTWADGEYVGQAFATKGNERHLVWQGKIIVQPNFDDEQIPDQRSKARIILDYIDDNFQSLVQRQAVSAEIEGVKLTFRSLKELQEVRNYWAIIVNAEDAKLTGRNRRAILAVFTKPGGMSPPFNPFGFNNL